MCQTIYAILIQVDNQRMLNIWKIDSILLHRRHAKGATCSVELNIDRNVLLHRVKGVSITLGERIHN